MKIGPCIRRGHYIQQGLVLHPSSSGSSSDYPEYPGKCQPNGLKAQIKWVLKGWVDGV